MDFYLANPISAVQGGVLLLHVWWGLNTYEVRVIDKILPESVDEH